MPEQVISDTCCFIVLTNIDELSLLQKVYGHIIVTPEVADEYAMALPDWVEIKSGSDKNLQQILGIQIDRGEASVIALAVEIGSEVVILDDYKARKVAERLGLAVTGTLGVIIKAKLRGFVPSIKPCLEKMKRTDFRITDELEASALHLAGE